MKNALLGIVLASCPLMATAANDNNGNVVGGVSYLNLSDSEDGFSISVGALMGSLGYKIPAADNFYLLPLVSIGIGVRDDSGRIGQVDFEVELDRFISLSVRGQFEFDNGVYLYAAPSYANAKFSVTATFNEFSASDSDDSWEFGLGGGIGFQFNETVAAEVSYEQFDGTDAVSVGFKFNFQ